MLGGLTDSIVNRGRKRIGSDQQDRRPSPTESNSQKHGVFGLLDQRKKQRQQGASFSPVGLVQAFLHGGSQQVAASLGEGSYQEGSGLDVSDSILAGVAVGQKSA